MHFVRTPCFRFFRFTCLALCMVPSFVSAQDVTANTAPAIAEQQVQARPPLWVLHHGDTTLYLMGTIHFLPSGTIWQSPEVKAAFESSETLVLEVAAPEDQAAVAPLIRQYGLSPDRPLSSLLTEAERARFDKAAVSIGRSAAQLDAMRPWLAGVLLSSAVTMRGGYDPGSGADLHLRNDAQATQKIITGLESPEDQIRMLSDFPEEGQLSFLRKTLDDFDRAPTDLSVLIRAWASGDIDAIDKVGLEPMRKSSPGVYQTVIVRRNARWAERLRAMLKTKGRYFVAVGVLHLVGPDSVQNLLVTEGIRFERVP